MYIKWACLQRTQDDNVIFSQSWITCRNTRNTSV